MALHCTREKGRVDRSAGHLAYDIKKARRSKNNACISQNGRGSKKYVTYGILRARKLQCNVTVAHNPTTLSAEPQQSTRNDIARTIEFLAHQHRETARSGEARVSDLLGVNFADEAFDATPLRTSNRNH